MPSPDRGKVAPRDRAGRPPSITTYERIATCRAGTRGRPAESRRVRTRHDGVRVSRRAHRHGRRACGSANARRRPRGRRSRGGDGSQILRALARKRRADAYQQQFECHLACRATLLRISGPSGDAEPQTMREAGTRSHSCASRSGVVPDSWALPRSSLHSLPALACGSRADTNRCSLRPMSMPRAATRSAPLAAPRRRSP